MLAGIASALARIFLYWKCFAKTHFLFGLNTKKPRSHSTQGLCIYHLTPPSSAFVTRMPTFKRFQRDFKQPVRPISSSMLAGIASALARIFLYWKCFAKTRFLLDLKYKKSPEVI
jgi:hypothetical protein